MIYLPTYLSIYHCPSIYHDLSIYHCLSIYLCIFIYLCLSIYLVCLSIFVYLSIFLYLSIVVPLSDSVHISIFPSIYLSIYLSIVNARWWGLRSHSQNGHHISETSTKSSSGEMMGSTEIPSSMSQTCSDVFWREVWWFPFPPLCSSRPCYALNLCCQVLSRGCFFFWGGRGKDTKADEWPATSQDDFI